MHFLRNALDHLPRRANDDCLQELRWIYDRREITEVRRDLAAWLSKWSGKYARLCKLAVLGEIRTTCVRRLISWFSRSSMLVDFMCL